MSWFNRDQQEHIEYLASLPTDAKCVCGWYARGECPNCRPDAGGFERCGNRHDHWTICARKRHRYGPHWGWPTYQAGGSLKEWVEVAAHGAAHSQEPTP